MTIVPATMSAAPDNANSDANQNQAGSVFIRR